MSPNLCFLLFKPSNIDPKHPIVGTESPQEQERNAAEEGSGSGDSTDTARSYWDRLPADTRRELARQEFVSFEANKQFQMYLKALILEAKNMHQKNYLELILNSLKF